MGFCNSSFGPWYVYCRLLSRLVLSAASGQQESFFSPPSKLPILTNHFTVCCRRVFTADSSHACTGRKGFTLVVKVLIFFVPVAASRVLLLWPQWAAVQGDSSGSQHHHPRAVCGAQAVGASGPEEYRHHRHWGVVAWNDCNTSQLNVTSCLLMNSFPNHKQTFSIRSHTKYLQCSKLCKETVLKGLSGQLSQSFQKQTPCFNVSSLFKLEPKQSYEKTSTLHCSVLSFSLETLLIFPHNDTWSSEAHYSFLSLPRSWREAAVWMIETVWLIWPCCTTAARPGPRASVGIDSASWWKVHALLIGRCSSLSGPVHQPIERDWAISVFCAGDAETAASFARQLLSLGADPNLCSRWTNMRALHYAAYFDVPQLIRVVLQASQTGGENIREPLQFIVLFWIAGVSGAFIVFSRASSWWCCCIDQEMLSFFFSFSFAVAWCTYWELILSKMTLQCW